ncbi:MAG TPA: hypothetical protein VN634_02430 [Candidatus Limnocylindrales bacterium]|nr:hypothetical protein [Candidatus Limnocylindrales bacterium]
MPHRPHILVEGRLLTDAAVERFKDAERNGFTSCDPRCHFGLQSAWFQRCKRMRRPRIEVVRRKATADIRIDVFLATDSEFPVWLQDRILMELRDAGARWFFIGQQGALGLHVPLSTADAVAAQLVRLIHHWLGMECREAVHSA